MSYDIGLYNKAFLREAIAQDLGDWRGAPSFAPEVVAGVKSRLIALGYSVEGESKFCVEFTYPNELWGLQASVFSGEIAFTAPYWDDSEAAIALAKEHARAIAREFDLGLIDRQDGEVIA
jgi:hypothetical protein